MSRNAALWLLWAGLLTYAFLLAPPDQPDTFDLIKNLSTGQIAGINPAIVALFNIMGVFPLIYACLLLFDGRMQSVRAYPFVVASFGVGAFGFLPYLALRHPNGTFTGQKSLLLKLLDSRWLGGAIALGAVGLVAYGVTQGDWGDFVQQWRSSRFIHVMSLDFCLLCLLVPTLLGDDMARRGLTDDRAVGDRVFWAVAVVPFLGVATYLALRPPIQETTTTPVPAAIG